jgi:hypothetical protein
MKHKLKMAMRWLSPAAITAIALGTAGTATAQSAVGASGWSNPLVKQYVKGKLDVCDQGAFFVGGVPKVTAYASSATAGVPQQITIGQAYVQFQIPKKHHQWPLVMVHGSTHTGAALDATPDGHEGWLSYAVQNNLATFVMDQPGRGRSGFDQSVILEGKAAFRAGNDEAGEALIPNNFGRITDNGSWTSWFGHIIPTGTDIITGRMIRHGDPGDPQPPEDPNNPSEAHGNYPPAFPIPPVPNSIDPKIQARMGALGPPPNPANWTYLALNYYKQLVPNGEATLPNSVCPTCVPQTVGPADTWSPRALAELVEGLGGAIVSPHSQSTSQVMHMVRILKEHGKLNLLKGIIIPEGAGTSLRAAGLVGSDFDHIPFLLVNGDYRPLATRIGNRAAAAEMNASPTRDPAIGPALVLDIEDPMFAGSLNGTTHMNMLGSTNLKLFDFFLEWAGKYIKNPMAKDKCEKK